jgi:hypothetical protein
VKDTTTLEGRESCLEANHRKSDKVVICQKVIHSWLTERRDTGYVHYSSQEKKLSNIPLADLVMP